MKLKTQTLSASEPKHRYAARRTQTQINSLRPLNESSLPAYQKSLRATSEPAVRNHEKRFWQSQARQKTSHRLRIGGSLYLCQFPYLVERKYQGYPVPEPQASSNPDSSTELKAYSAVWSEWCSFREKADRQSCRGWNRDRVRRDCPGPETEKGSAESASGSGIMDYPRKSRRHV